MFRNYLVTALRNLMQHRLYSFINIAGLAVGLACVLFVMLFVRDQLSYDKWLPDSANLFRVEDSLVPPGGASMNLARSPFSVIAALKDNLPEVRAMTRLAVENITVTVNGRQFSDSIDVVDPNFLQVVKLPLIAGDPASALSQPVSLILSETLARKYFGDADPIGRTVTMGRADCPDADSACRNQPVSLKVTGVLRDVPANSQLTVHALMPNTSIADRVSQAAKQSPTAFNAFGYIQLAPGADPAAVMRKTVPILDTLLAGAVKQANLNMRGSQILKLHLTRFADVHLNSEIYNGSMTRSGSWITVYGVAVVGLLILLVACFNFMNLATARALLRAREISLRKSVGASRRQLVVQFLGEALLMALLSLILALAMVEISLPAFAQFVEQPVSFNYVSDWPVLLAIVTVALVAGLFSGFYPALVLSGFRPAMVLRSNSSNKAGSGWLRGLLVILQFSVSIGLGIAAIVVFSQIGYARNVALGYRYDQVLVVDTSPLTATARESFSQILRSHSGILNVALANMVPFSGNFNIGLAQVPGKSGNISINRISIDPDFANLYAIPLLAGRMFSRAHGEDTYSDERNVPANEGHNILINKAGAVRLGFTPQQAIGQTIVLNNYHVHIIGVLADTKLEGARAPAEPAIYYNDAKENTVLSVRVAGGASADAAGFIDRTWHSFAPMTAARRGFLKDDFSSLYKTDEKQGTLFGILVGIAIAIACLGLFGLAAFTASRRTKEIGVRKVSGARTPDVVLLLLWQFSIPVLAANLIAWPIAWYYLHGWLQGFADRISLSPLYFIGAGLTALLVAWMTVFAHAYRVARANPIHALRYE